MGEIREANAASSAQELALKLERIEAEGLKRINIRNNNTQKNRKSNNENERLDLKSNLIHSLSEKETKEKAFSEAWRVKLDQLYEKAKLLLADDPRFSEIQSTYKNIHRKIKKQKIATLVLR